MIEKPRITRSVLADDAGRLMERSVQVGPKGHPWRDLTQDEDDLTASRPSAFLYPKDGSPIVPLKEVRISVSATRFVAGQEDVGVSVKGLEPGEKCGIRINSSRYELDHDDVVLIEAEGPGVYTISLDDAAHWADVDQYTVMAISQS